MPPATVHAACHSACGDKSCAIGQILLLGRGHAPGIHYADRGVHPPPTIGNAWSLDIVRVTHTNQQDTNKAPPYDMHAKALTGHKRFMQCACSGAMAPDAYSGASHAAS